MAKTVEKENVPTLREVPGVNALAEATPDFMKGYAGQGSENVPTSAVEIPRIKLLQALSPEVEQGDAKAGSFYHTLLEDSLGTALDIVPVYMDTRYILWRPQDDGGGILARADDGVHWNPPDASFNVMINKKTKKVTWKTKPTVDASGLAAWGSFDPEDPASQPAATMMYNIVCCLPSLPDIGPVVVTLQRSAVRAAKKLMGKIKLSRAPSYGMVFSMESMKDTNSNNQSFYNYKFTSKGFVANKDLFEEYRRTYEQFKELGLQVRDMEGLQDEAVADTSAAGPMDGKF